MKKSRFEEEQIIVALQQLDSGVSAKGTLTVDYNWGARREAQPAKAELTRKLAEMLEGALAPSEPVREAGAEP